MCGRFVAASDPEGLVRFFVVDERQGEELPPRYNVAPTQQVYAVAEHDDARHLVTFRWGLIPRWAKDAKIGSKLINARAETAHEKPAFRSAFTKRRCLIPADGFYEWKKQESGGKVPHFIHPAEAERFAFAGLWESWRDPEDPDGEPLRTCVILTTAANQRLRALHDRMPVILPAEVWDAWLARDHDDVDALRGLLRPAPDDAVAFHPVSTSVNRPSVDHPGLIEPVPA